jgi:lysine 2,3-aminomutase
LSSEQRHKKEFKHKIGDEWWKKFSIWKDVSKEDFLDWRWQYEHLINSPEKLFNAFPWLDEEEQKGIVTVSEVYPLLISPYYLSLVDPYDKFDPIRMQCFPSREELLDTNSPKDPLAEGADEVVPNLVHRYPDRALYITTNFCATYCRFCTRKRILGKISMSGVSSLQKVVDYLKQNEHVHDIVISGGDPLTLPNRDLEKILSELSAIDSIDTLRLGSRVPVTLPMRLFDDELLELLEKYSDLLWLNTHFNHPNEITEVSYLAIRNILRLGIPINNQTVLLKGVNDDVEVMRKLMLSLIKIKVRPYYLFHCDPTKGIAHFRTTIWKGLEIMEGLRGHISGLAVPTYVVDAPGGGGKIPIMPNYVISMSEDRIVLRNFEGSIVSYDPTGKSLERKENRKFEGIISLLRGDLDKIDSLNSERIKRREKRSRH